MVINKSVFLKCFGVAVCLALLKAGYAQGLGVQTPSAAGLDESLLRNAAGSQSANAQEAVVDYIEVLVNGRPITHKEVLALEQILLQQGAQAQANISLYELALEQLIVQKALLAEARTQGIQVSDAELDRAVTNIASSNQVSEAQLRQSLYEEGQSFSLFREGLREEIALSRLEQQQKNQLVTVTEDEILEQITQMEQAQQLSGMLLNLGHILVLAMEDESQERRKAQEEKIRKAYQALASGAAFAQVAKQYSEAPEAAVGGDLGLRRAAEYPAFFLDAVQGVPEGNVTAVLRSRVGYHILKVLSREGGDTGEKQPFVQTKTHLRHILLMSDSGQGAEQAREKLLQLKQAIEDKSAGFATLAKENSKDGSANQGGNLGWVGPGDLVPEFEQAMNALAVGEISDPVVSRFGVHLIQVLDRKQEALTEGQVRSLVERAVRAQKQEQKLQKWVQRVRQKAFVEERGLPVD